MANANVTTNDVSYLAFTEIWESPEFQPVHMFRTYPSGDMLHVLGLHPGTASDPVPLWLALVVRPLMTRSFGIREIIAYVTVMTDQELSGWIKEHPQDAEPAIITYGTR